MIGKAIRFATYLLRRALFPVLERILPANDNLWCFCTWERHSHTVDNPRAVLEVIRKDPSITCIVLQKVRSPEDRDEGNVRFVPAESLRGACYLARSRVVLLGYALRGMASYASGLTKKHLVIQLLHGVSQRRVGLMFPRETWWAAETPKYSAMVASSLRERGILAEAFKPIPPERIWITGLPRNDILFCDDSDLPTDYRNHLASVRALLRGRRLVLYAPTWRDQQAGHYKFSAAEADRLSELLRQHNAVLGIHGHPNVRHKGWYRVDNPPEEILDLVQFPDVTLILRETSVLISDYSSIFLDFVLTGRPILHFAYDFDAYLASRIGFLYEPHEYFTGSVPKTFDELCEHLEFALVHGQKDPAQYAKVRAVFHQHGDQPSREVAKLIKTLVEG